MRLYFCISRSYSDSWIDKTNSDRYFKEHIFCHPPDEGHVGNSSDFLIRWHPSRGQLRVDGLNLHPERWKSHKKISNLSFGTSGEWQSVRSAPLGIFYHVDLFLLRYGALDITAGDKYCGTLLKNLSGFLVFCVAWISKVEIQNFMIGVHLFKGYPAD